MNEKEIQSFPAEKGVIQLAVPYTTLSGQHIESVTMRAPTVRDRLMRNRNPAPDYQADIELMASLCGMTLDDLMNMEACDYLRLEKQFNNFLLPPAKRKTTV
ncbi:phage tail assembly protein [Citrobacter sp. CtB7.12]|uniref:phage tail assembly protein n=1 Tax=Citrobacter sp. CtB7.12 TaxID=1696093 RepID=UPI0006BA11C1|nr:phage tail assembly protein [Citrobacter sp. CtB7.12]